MKGVPKLRRCKCQARAEMWYMPLTGAYTVRCTRCTRKTPPHITEKMAAEDWNEKYWKGDQA